MDFSRQYAQMCQGALEIQEKVSEENQDYNFWYVFYEFRTCPNESHDPYRAAPSSSDRYCPICKGDLEVTRETAILDSPDKVNSEKSVWLPRQDQLQELYRREWKPGHKLDMFYKWFMYEAEGVGSQNSMEQLWLAYVMDKKYGKIWNRDQGWVKKESKRLRS